MVARAKWEKFSAIFCNIFTKKKTPENTMSLRTSVATLVWQSVFPSLPLRGWCSAQRIRITMIAGGNHAIMYRWLEEPDEVAF